MRHRLVTTCAALGVAWSAVFTGPSASAALRASCEFRPTLGILVVGGEASSVGMRRRADDILVDGRSCGATVWNTDSIRVRGRDRGELVALHLNYGVFAPGRTPESDGVSEIEISLDLGGPDRRGNDALYLWMTPEDDTFAAGVDGVDLNGDGDVDLDVAGRLHLGGLSTLGGSDTVTMTVDEASTASLPFSTAGDITLGSGTDRAAFTGTSIRGDPVRVFGDEGDDSIWADTGEWTAVGGSGDDALTIGSGGGLLDGGDGDDVLTGASGNDYVFGQRGNDVLTGGPGDDIFVGDQGEDVIEGEGGHDIVEQSDDEEQPDFFSGGSGIDQLLYNVRSERDLWVSFDGIANDGARGEHDNIAADFEEVLTGYGDDVLVGDDQGQRLSGNKGSDIIIGGGGRDTIYGMLGRDEITGGARRDTLDGGKGNDVFHTADGTIDRVWGGIGDDRAVDRDPFDHIHQIEAF